MNQLFGLQHRIRVGSAVHWVGSAVHSKKPSAERENAILAHIHRLGKEMMAVCFYISGIGASLTTNNFFYLFSFNRIFRVKQGIVPLSPDREKDGAAVKAAPSS